MLFQTTKIQTFESNSQLSSGKTRRGNGCSRLQRYKLLKAIHNKPVPMLLNDWLFQTTKIQTFESNSQRISIHRYVEQRCSRLQRYKLLKAIHNKRNEAKYFFRVVPDYKDTNFWKQFTTGFLSSYKLQCCFRLQRYKLLKAIHNTTIEDFSGQTVVSDYKDTNFWKQFTTGRAGAWRYR